MARLVIFIVSVLITSYVVLILVITIVFNIINIDGHHVVTTPQTPFDHPIHTRPPTHALPVSEVTKPRT